MRTLQGWDFGVSTLQQHPLPKNNGSNRNVSFTELVDNPVAVSDQFQDAIIFEFWNLASRLRKRGEVSRKGHNLLDDCSRIGRRVCGNVGRDRFQILQRSPRLPYSVSHGPRRAPASCWLTFRASAHPPIPAEPYPIHKGDTGCLPASNFQATCAQVAQLLVWRS